CQQHHRYPYSF
nr:immunoglobulin light chain junction region [Macaca mulatta]MOW73422.1 immunoglobulin light chain junction region [Macaca mulatta]